MSHGDAPQPSSRTLLPKHYWFVLACVALLVAADLPQSYWRHPEGLALEVQLLLGLGALGFAMAARTTGSGARLLARLTAILIALGVAGDAAEAATRWMFRDVTTAADSRSFFSRSSESVQFNKRGFRERDVPDTKPPGTYRIAVLGDSLTFGNGLEAHQRYSNILDATMHEGFEVLNFGIPGDNTPQHLDVLRERALALQPDFGLLQWFINDIEGDDLAHRPQPWPLVPVPDVHRWLNRHSAFYSLANMRWAGMQVMMGLVPSYSAYLRDRAGDPKSDDARRDDRLLRQIAATAQRSGARFGMVLFPDFGEDMGPAYPYAFLHERVLAFCRESGVTCLDLRDTFARVHDRRSLWVSPFDHHPSARANEMAAVKILEAFRPEWATR